MTIEDFLSLRRLLSVAHHVPGRMRIKFSPAILECPAARALAQIGGGRPGSGLLNARLNVLACSLVLEYDVECIGSEDLQEFFTSSDMPKVRELAERVATLLGLQLNPD